MSNKGFSRREFMVKGTIGLGLAVTFELSGLGGAVNARAVKALAAEAAKERIMPHVSVMLWPGRSEEDKKRLAEAITEDVVRITGASPASVSVSIEDVPSDEWKERVYDPEVRDKADLLYKKPGYSM
ncbi:Tautomerase PptA [Pseudodesulfovibrio hydrargyri]|uniref:Tautomerase PptA n=1 Tax=Pseudodesulfovibrio hydrargyri TaxID=2125990 RepID=A0A1J5N3E3_9BACT|nr:tautomerase family protein [Pseudodesulfovibrio hydrargyri]OIQ50131.1 Tautomerase PptA [Pseudodesulfovibrio hydrargyri]